MDNQFDLHLHSSCSDGDLSPQDVVKEARKAGRKTIALTDHDNVGGVALAIAEGERIGVKVIPGVEFSTDYEGEEHHVLGLFINYQAPILKDLLKENAESKRKQISEMVERMRQAGFVLTMDEVYGQSKGSVNRVHIAKAVVASAEKNGAILKRLGLTSQDDVLRHLLKEDSPYFVKRERPPLDGMINFIQWLDGLAVWAHPNWRDTADVINKKALVFKRDFGLDALEVCYSRDYQTVEQALALHQLALSLSMYETAGSDFHSPNKSVFNKIGNFVELSGIELNLPPQIMKESP
jgi:hypothetical protein